MNRVCGGVAKVSLCAVRQEKDLYSCSKVFVCFGCFCFEDPVRVLRLDEVFIGYKRATQLHCYLKTVSTSLQGCYWLWMKSIHRSGCSGPKGVSWACSIFLLAFSKTDSGLIINSQRGYLMEEAT